MIQDLSELLKGASFEGGKADVHARFEVSVLGIKDGLYVFLFENQSDRRVRDNNTRPKTVIGTHGASLKPGKFENGFIVRMRNYHDHLRRENEGGQVDHVFQECLRLALVLDLSTVRVGLPSSARVFEHYWNESISAFLEDETLLVGTQNGRAEWRSVQPSLLASPAKDKLRDLASRLASNIHRMAAALPRPT
jgi:hypothetical protein